VSPATATATPEVVLSTYDEVHHAFRSRTLRQALYDEGGVVMADCLLTLHGDEHRTRRRLENRLFRREMFTRWERDTLGATVDEVLAPAVAAGHGDLIALGYRTTMNLTALVAGIDRTAGTTEETDHLYRFVRAFSEGATLVHSTRDHDEVRAEVQGELERFDDEFLTPSIRRRRAALDAVAAGEADEADLPRDVLTTLLGNEDDLALPHEVVRREIAFYLQAGSHSTANAFTHTFDELMGWVDTHPEVGRPLLERAANGTLSVADRRFLQRCVHETLRLHPASPVAWRRPTETTVLAGGVELPAGALVVLEVAEANRDPARWGADADMFDPRRAIPEGCPPWGHSFGGGPHACIGAELDGGMEWRGGPDHDSGPGHGGGGNTTNGPDYGGGTGTDDAHLYGTVEVMVEAVLRAGGRPDPEAPAQLDPTSTRRHFASYPVQFTARAGER